MINALKKINNPTTLNLAKRGERFSITSLPKGEMKSQLIRMGIAEGDLVDCVERLPGGTIVIRKNRQEIALGHNLAEKINIIIQ